MMCQPCLSLQEHLKCDKALAAQSQSGARNIAEPEPGQAWERPNSPRLFWAFTLCSQSLPVVSEKLLQTKHLLMWQMEENKPINFPCTTLVSSYLFLARKQQLLWQGLAPLSLIWNERKVEKLTALPSAFERRGAKFQNLGLISFCKGLPLPPFSLSG